MFSTELSTGFAVFCLVGVAFGLALWWWVRAVSARINDALHYLHTQNKNAVSLRKLAELEAGLSELSDSYEVLLTSVKKLGARARARAARENGSKPVDSGPPDGEADRAAYKARLRDQLRKDGRL